MEQSSIMDNDTCKPTLEQLASYEPIGHWRGFDKVQTPDGRVWAYSNAGGGRCTILGPFLDGEHADSGIIKFYDNKR